MSSKANGRIAQAWHSFERAVVPAAASKHQRDAMKSAFYGGGYATLMVILEMLDPGAEPTAEDLLKMHEIHGEFKQYNLETLRRAQKGLN